MIEYIYKGFKLSYTILPTEHTSFRADGALTYLLKQSICFKPKKFCTEYPSSTGAEHEIKKLLENYVNFELKNYYDMKKEREILELSDSSLK